MCISVANPCDRKKCEWLCLLSPSGPVCTCPNDRVADNGTCVELSPATQSPVSKCRLCSHYSSTVIELSTVMRSFPFSVSCLLVFSPFFFTLTQPLHVTFSV